MTLRIRCPNCRHITSIDEARAGTTVLCPGCGVPLVVPVPIRDVAPLVPADGPAVSCPRCRHVNALGTAVCRRCGTNLDTGRPPSWAARIRLVSWRGWAIAGGSLASVILLAFFAANLLPHLLRQPSPDSGMPVAATPPPADDRVLATALFAAEGAAALPEVAERLWQAGPRAVPAVAAALAASLDAGVDAAAAQRLALRFMALHADAHEHGAAWAGVLERCQRVAALRDDAVWARGALGDPAVAPELVELWRDALRRALFLQRIAAGWDADEPAGARLMAARAATESARYAHALRRIAARDVAAVLTPALERYWDSWTWLGQARGEEYAAAAFALAQPFRPGGAAGARSPDELTADIRGARRALDGIAAEAPPLAAAAAGIVLIEQSPQYRSARGRVEQRLAALLPECPPDVQQRVIWAVARLTGRSFALYTDKAEPWDVNADVAQAVFAWAGEQGVAVPPEATRRLAFPPPPVLRSRVVPARLALERELLAELGDWRTAPAALQRWSAAGLGYTPSVATALYPGQRQPNLCALAAAMVIASESRAGEARPALLLWQQARDQPAWVRSLAHTALAALEPDTANWTSGWPTGLENDAFVALAQGRPGWDYFGRVLAAGGAPVVQRLRTYEPLPISSSWRERLLRAAEQAARPH
jgi:phage FluMu protein Com